ncbi:hypothetical protein ACFWR9_09590 [Streptomyces sp. NPDC058534]|uniref:hypothetical protein n=1 Tax=Streptomyces sp. NPDC058534 TaxID=3346541 RepID=UPI0036694490
MTVRPSFRANSGARAADAQAAEASRCPVGTVRSRVSRARLTMAEWPADEPEAHRPSGTAVA